MYMTVIRGKARMEICRIVHGLYWVQSSRWSQFSTCRGETILDLTYGGIEPFLKVVLALNRLSQSRLLHTAGLHQH